MLRSFAPVFLTAHFLALGCATPAVSAGFTSELLADRLVIRHDDQSMASFVFRDERILRPYFANLHAPGGVKVTRNHPPLPGQDASDHETMHPGVWLAFGDLSGQDFWRNKARIEHVRFTELPKASDERLAFGTECRLRTTNGAWLCSLTNRLLLATVSNAWILVWDATFRSSDGDFTFGDQEEMGFGARVATAITERNGGLITGSTGEQTARQTWGRAFDWCDYSGPVAGRRIGILLMADPANFRSSWWHNRDYGLMVANPFGRGAMKQGERSEISVKRGEVFHLRFGAILHSSPANGPDLRSAWYRQFLAVRVE